MNKIFKKVKTAFGSNSDEAKSTRAAMSAFAVRLFSAAFVYFSHIVLARWMGAKEFGVYTYVWTWVIILGQLSTLGFSVVMVRHLANYFKADKIGEFLGLIFLGRVVSIILAVGIAAIGIAGVYWLGDAATSIYVMPLILGLICLPLFALVDMQEGICRANEWVLLALLPNYLLRPILILGISGILIYVGEASDAQTIMVACIVASCLTAVVQIVALQRKIRIKLGKKATTTPRKFDNKAWMSLALTLLLADSFILIMANTDIVFLQYFMQPEDIAVYYAAMKTTLLVGFIYFAVVMASSNKFSEHWHDDDKEKLTKAINHSVVMTFAPSLFASLGIIAVGYWFLKAYGDDFTRGYSVIVILSMGAIVKAATGPAEWMMTMMGQQKMVLWVTGSASVANIILNIVMIPIWGLEGAAAATSIATAGSALVLFFRVKHELKIPIKFAGLF